MKLDYVLPICALIVSALAFCVSIVTILVNLHQKKIDNLLSLHQFLHQADLSEARRSVREDGCEITLKNTAVRRVCSSFDFAGTMVRNGVVNRKLFFQYWAIPLMTLCRPLALIGHEHTGDRVEVMEYYKDLWWLFEQAKKYIPPAKV